MWCILVCGFLLSFLLVWHYCLDFLHGWIGVAAIYCSLRPVVGYPTRDSQRIGNCCGCQLRWSPVAVYGCFFAFFNFFLVVIVFLLSLSSASSFLRWICPVSWKVSRGMRMRRRCILQCVFVSLLVVVGNQSKMESRWSIDLIDRVICARANTVVNGNTVNRIQANEPILVQKKGSLF